MPQVKKYLVAEYGAIPLLLLVAFLGLVGFFVVSSLGVFRSNLFSSLFPKPPSQAATTGDWYMAGANPQRTSWVPTSSTNQTEMTGQLKPDWYVPIEPYVHPKFQVIASMDMIFVSTARGLYAFDANSGAQKWVYPTELPLGNSSTIYNGVAYVGGYDRKIHAIDALTGQKKWTFEAGAGFETNPLVINNVVYMGSRDNYFYAVDATTGQLKWKYQTGGAILFSAAIKPDNSTVYFASNDGYGYALNSGSGALVWKTQKLPGQGFHMWWPVYYSHPTQGDYVIFGGEWDSRDGERPAGKPGPWGSNMLSLEYDALYPNRFTQSNGEFVAPKTAAPIPGDWALGMPTLDASKPNVMGTGLTTAVSEYFEEPTASQSATDPLGDNRLDHKPWRRTYLVLDAATGIEKTYDFDGDGQKEYAPITTSGITRYGNRFPPVVGGDNVLYQNVDYISTTHIASAGVVGWKINSPYWSLTARTVGGVDQPEVYSGAGKLIYFSAVGDRAAGAFDITDTTAKFGLWRYFDNNVPAWDINLLLPGYDSAYIPTPADDDNSPYKYMQNYGGLNGSYGRMSMAQNPPIPYKGRVYILKGNSLIAFKANATTAVKLPLATTVSAPAATTVLTKTDLQLKLEDQIRKMIQAGHLKPGIADSGATDSYSDYESEGLLDYFHNPFDTIYTLLRVRPLLTDPTLKSQLDSYIQSEWTNFNPATINHIGFKDGVWRDDFTKMPEVDADALNMPKTSGRYSHTNEPEVVWDFNPMAWYAMWMYAKTYGNAPAIFNSGLTSTPLMDSFVRIMNPTTVTDATLAGRSWAHNGYIAGLIGFSNLYDLAVSQGMASIPGNISTKYPYSIAQLKSMKDTQMVKRAQNFTKNTPYPQGSGYTRDRFLNPARSFIFMVPELADFLATTPTVCADGTLSLTCVNNTVAQFDRITPYWFVSQFDDSSTEAAYQSLYDYHSLLQAKALILKEPFEELVKDLDVPAFARGDLFYIDNLVSLLNAPVLAATAVPNPSPTPPPLPGDLNGNKRVDIFDYNTLLFNFGKAGVGYAGGDIDLSGRVGLSDYNQLLFNFGKSIP